MHYLCQDSIWYVGIYLWVFCKEMYSLQNKYIVFQTLEEYNVHHSTMHQSLNHRAMEFNFNASQSNEMEMWNMSGPIDVSIESNEDFPALTNNPRPAPVLSMVDYSRLSAPESMSNLSTYPSLPRPVASNVNTQSNHTLVPTSVLSARNRNLAQALELENTRTDAIPTPAYSPDLIAWGKSRLSEVRRIELRLQQLIENPKSTSIQLWPMPREKVLYMHLTFFPIFMNI